MPIQIESVINQISPEKGSDSGATDSDARWQKMDEISAILDLQQYQCMRVAAEDFND